MKRRGIFGVECGSFLWNTTASIMRRQAFCTVALILTLASFLCAKNDFPIVMMWPSDKPALKLTFEKFRNTGSYNGQNAFATDVTVQNLTEKQIPRASFMVYLLDKNKIRVGNALLLVSDLEAGQSAKVQFQFNSVGIPVSLSIAAKNDILAPGGRTISLKILSVPPGAKLKVDGQDVGTTPVMARFTIGTHQLDLSKEGYAAGNTPLEVTADELSGGSITVELGGMSRDTVELRDGAVVLGDVVSVSMTQVVVHSEGKEQIYDRNQVKKIMLVERQVTVQPVVVQPASASPQ